jgi:hypothetical protein
LSLISPPNPADARASGESTTELSMRMVGLLAGFQQSQALYAVAKLGIATALAAGPMPVADLAAATGTHPEALRRLLHIASALDVVEHREDDAYALTSLGTTLAADTPGSVQDVAVAWMETHYAPFAELTTTIRTGVPAADAHFGQSFVEWLATEPGHAAQVSAAMSDLTYGAKQDLLNGYELPAGEIVADIGGADGSVLVRLLAEAPGRRGVIFDLEHVAVDAHARLAKHQLNDRVEVVAGDFFENVPQADVYLLSTVLHDWDDEACARILGRIAEAGSPGARLVIIESILAEGDEQHASKLFDLTMLAMTPGRERDLSDFTALLNAAGFSVDRCVSGPAHSPYSVLEATLTGAPASQSGPDPL